MSEQLVTVVRHRGHWCKLDVPEDALSGFHITDVSGAVGARSPSAMLAAYMMCSDIPDGSEFPHSCVHGPPPHEVKVLIQKVDNDKRVYRRLHEAASAGGQR